MIPVKDRTLYISGPYTEGDTVAWIHHCAKVTTVLRKMGWMVIPPVLITHTWHLVDPQEYKFWLDYDLELLELCSHWVRGYGYDAPSKGSVIERGRALALGLTVYETLEVVPDLIHDPRYNSREGFGISSRGIKNKSS